MPNDPFGHAMRLSRRGWATMTPSARSVSPKECARMKQRNRTSVARSAGVVALGLAASAGHVLYPATLWALTRSRPSNGRREMTAWPSVTVLLPAYREAGVIAAKVEDIRANGYQGQLE